jgi:hypothetical protein
VDAIERHYRMAGVRTWKEPRQEQLTPGVSPLYFGSDGVLSTSAKLRPFLPQGSASATWAATEEKFENLPKGM